MTTLITTGSVAEMIYIEDGERVYPCRCGETHRGPYAAYDWDHHNCLHEGVRLVALDSEGLPGLSMCPLCGQAWHRRNL